jgi:hypothetical protein
MVAWSGKSKQAQRGTDNRALQAAPSRSARKPYPMCHGARTGIS